MPGRSTHGAALDAACATGVALALAFSFVGPIGDADYWWHLRAGEEILETHALPATDPMLLTIERDDDPDKGGSSELLWRYPPLSRGDYRSFILTCEWLSDVALAAAHAAGGHGGPVLLAALLGAAALALAFGFAARLGAPPWLACLAASAAGFELWKAVVPRPQIFSYVLAGAFVWLFDRLRDVERASSSRSIAVRVAALASLAIAWGNLHAAWIVGALIGAAFLAGEVLERIVRGRARLAPVAAGLAAACAGFALNPNGWTAVPASFAVSGALFTRAVAEWQPPAGATNALFFVLAALAAAAILAAVASRRAPAAHVLLVFGFAAMGMLAVRHIPFFLIAGLPVATVAAARVARAFAAAPLERAAALAPLGLVTAAASSLVLVATRGPHHFGVDDQELPVALAEHVAALPVEGPVFNTYEYGGYLLWALDPPRRIFIDGRSLSERAKWENQQVIRAQRPLYPGVLDEYGIRILALRILLEGGLLSDLVVELAGDDRWAPTFVGPNNVVFVDLAALPAGAGPPEDLRPRLVRRAIALVESRGREDQKAYALARLHARIGELDAAARHAAAALEGSAGLDPAEVSARRTKLARALGDARERAGDLARAFAEYRAAADRDPELAARAARVALRHAEQSGAGIDRAVEGLRAAAAAGTCDREAHEALDRYAGDLDAVRALVGGFYRRAIREAGARVSAAPADAEAHFLLGTALLRVCSYDEAVSAFERATDLEGGLGSAQPATVLNLGWALLDGGRLDRAFAVFEEVSVRAPGERVALYGAGLAAKLSGRREPAERYFRRYIALAPPGDPWAREAEESLSELDRSVLRGL